MTTPYFYIIQHVRSGKLYAGSRYATGCDPAELLTEGGYFTSSNTIKKIIEIEGLFSFHIRKIKVFKSIQGAIDYETSFLKRVNAKDNEQFFNAHNNTLIFPFLGTVEFKNVLEDRYGVKNPSHMSEVIEKIRKTKFERYGDAAYNNAALAVANKRKKGSYRNQAEKISGKNNTSYGKKWYTNGIDNLYLMPDDTIPSGYHPGMTCKFPDRSGNNNQAHGKKWYTNGEKNLYLLPTESVPVGYYPGQTRSKITNNSGSNNANFGKRWFTDGRTNVMLKPDDNVPSGFWEGQTKERIVCPHCGLEGNKGGTMSRYHMDNCKKRRTNSDD